MEIFGFFERGEQGRMVYFENQIKIVKIFRSWCIIIVRMIEQGSAEVHVRIGELQNDERLPSTIKDQRIGELRRSLTVEQGTDSSFKVITSIANTMIGSSIIVYPIVFIKDGMVGSLLVLIAIGTALFFTCRLLLVHNRPDEPDFSYQIKRILGPKWARLNSVVNILLIFVVSIAYFMLISGNFFDITAAIFAEIADYVPPKAGTFVFNKYSVQYASMIAILFTAPLIFRRDIQFLLKFFKYTIYLVFAYGIFIVASFIRVLAQGSLHFAEYKAFDPDFSTVAGAFALSLLLHPVAAPILKRNVKQENNPRDLLLGYILTAMIYVFVGFIGGLTCANSVTDVLQDETGEYNTIFDCFQKDQNSNQTEVSFFLLGKIVQFGIFIQNLSVMPILSFLTRKQFVAQFQNENHKQKAYYGYNITLIVLCIIVTFFEIDVSVVISLNGAIVGFFMAYAIPIASHLACYHQKLTPHEQQQRSESLLSVSADQSTREQSLKCNKHPHRSRLRHWLIYGGLLVMGIAVAIFKIFSLFESK